VIWTAALAVILVVLGDWPLRNLRELSDDLVESQEPSETSDVSTKSEGVDWRSYLWRVSVAVLTGLIPVITLLGPKHGSQPTHPVVVTLVLVVVALAALQLYGQNSENLERIESKSNFNEQSARIEAILAAIGGGAEGDIEDERGNQGISKEQKATEGRDEDLGDPATSGASAGTQPISSELEAAEQASQRTIYEDIKRRIAQNLPVSSQLREAFFEDPRTIFLLEEDCREKYDEGDQGFLEYLRDDYEEWKSKFLQAFPFTEHELVFSLFNRWPLFTGLIGTSYNFGVDWTRKHASLIVPEEDILRWIDSWILRLDLNSLRDEEIYPYLKNAIESSIRYGLQKSIDDLVNKPERLPD
jgi:hypothetical protein